VKRRGRAVLAVALVVTAVLETPSSAEASPRSARASWARGKQLLAQKRGPEAVEALEQAASEDPSSQIQLDLARALVLVSALEEAHVLLDSLELDADRVVAAASKKLHTQVLGRLPTVTVAVVGSDALITLSGRTLEPNVPTPVNPGRYDLEVRRDGEVVLKRRITLVEKAHETIEVAPEQRRDAPLSATSAAARGNGTYLPAALAYAVSGAGLTLGAIVGVMAFDATKEVEIACGGSRCVGDHGDAIDRANTLAHLSTGSFVAGALGLGLGLTFTFTLGPGDERATSTGVQAFVEGPSAGVRARFD
jgi:hypothetical protein